MEYIYIGKIVNTHGIKGELRLISNFDKKDKVFKPNFTIYIGKEHIEEKIKTYRKHKSFDMISLEGYDNINEVLKYKNSLVYASKEDIILEEDEYILEELIGMEVIESGEILGKVAEIVYNGSNILLSISASKNFYIPNNKNFIKKVDKINKKIIVENSKGLIL